MTRVCLGISLTLVGTLAAAPVWAEREVHVVSVAEGWTPPNDLWAVPEARVHLDRPDKMVTLVLLDRGPLNWHVTLGDGTGLERLILGGSNPQDSGLWLSEIEMQGAEETGLPVVLEPRGSRFRALVAQVTEVTGLPSLDGFYGRYGAAPTGFVIDSARRDPAFAPDYLAPQLAPQADLPEGLHRWQDRQAAALALQAAQQVGFDDSGITWGLRRFDAPADVPAIRFPQAAVRDARTDVFYGLSLGGTGYIYRMDGATEAWSVLVDLARYDGARLMLDAPRDRLIVTGAFGRPGEIRFFGLDGTAQGQVKIPVFAFPGLTDLYDFGLDDPPALTPVDVTDGWLVLVAGKPEAGAFRTYGVELATNTVLLLAFGP